MAKLARKNQKIFTGNGAANSLAVFGTMKSGTAQYSTDVETLQSTAYTQGWDEAILNDKAPYLEEMNGVQYGLSYQAAYILEQGVPEYSATQTYYVGSICKVLNNTDITLYISLTDNNTGNAVTDTFNWSVFGYHLYAKRDLSNVTNIAQVRVITETNKTGNRWYRVYDDKWCEQGGVSSAGTITFTKAFADGTATVLGAGVGSITATNFVLGTSGSWMAMGYLP